MSDLTIQETRYSVSVNEQTTNLSISSTDLTLSLIEQPIAVDISLNNPGPPGPAGPFFEFDQPTPSALWTINHNLGFYPDIALFTVGGAKFEAETINISVNQVQVFHSAAIAGRARLN